MQTEQEEDEHEPAADQTAQVDSLHPGHGITKTSISQDHLQNFSPYFAMFEIIISPNKSCSGLSCHQIIKDYPYPQV